MHRLQCSEVWGGIKNEDLDACSRTVTASLHSSACNGGKGGDIYYVSVCAHDMITRIAVADVAGHGEPVSSISQWLYQSLRQHMNGPPGQDVLVDLNRLATERGFEALTTAAVVGVCKVDDNAYFSYAGHPPVLLRRRDEGRWTPVSVETDRARLVNLPLGVDRRVTYEDRLVPIQTGDRLLLYTDGVIEVPGADGDLFGQERLEATLAQLGDASPYEIKSAILTELRRHAGGQLDHDDVTLLAIEVL